MKRSLIPRFQSSRPMAPTSPPRNYISPFRPAAYSVTSKATEEANNPNPRHPRFVSRSASLANADFRNRDEPPASGVQQRRNSINEHGSYNGNNPHPTPSNYPGSDRPRQPVPERGNIGNRGAFRGRPNRYFHTDRVTGGPGACCDPNSTVGPTPPSLGSNVQQPSVLANSNPRFEPRGGNRYFQTNGFPRPSAQLYPGGGHNPRFRAPEIGRGNQHRLPYDPRTNHGRQNGRMENVPGSDYIPLGKESLESSNRGRQRLAHTPRYVETLAATPKPSTPVVEKWEAEAGPSYLTPFQEDFKKIQARHKENMEPDLPTSAAEENLAGVRSRKRSAELAGLASEENEWASGKKSGNANSHPTLTGANTEELGTRVKRSKSAAAATSGIKAENNIKSEPSPSPAPHKATSLSPAETSVSSADNSIGLDW